MLYNFLSRWSCQPYIEQFVFSTASSLIKIKPHISWDYDVCVSMSYLTSIVKASISCRCRGKIYVSLYPIRFERIGTKILSNQNVEKLHIFPASNETSQSFCTTFPHGNDAVISVTDRKLNFVPPNVERFLTCFQQAVWWSIPKGLQNFPIQKWPQQWQPAWNMSTRKVSDILFSSSIETVYFLLLCRLTKLPNQWYSNGARQHGQSGQQQRSTA